MTIEQAMQVAVGCHQAGRLDEAERIYREVLRVQPAHPEALHLLGLIACQTGHDATGAELIGRAIALHPSSAEYHNNHGRALARSGKWDEAIAAHRRALQLQPGYAEAHSNLGNALAARGLVAEAIAEYRRAIQAKPDYAQGHYNLGNALGAGGRLDEAIAAYQRALELKPDYAAALTNMGNLLSRQNRIDEAIAALQRAIAITPDLAEAHNNLGTALVARGRFEGADAAFQRALALRPDFSRTLFNVGNMLATEGRIEDAVAAYRRACALEPGFAEGHSALIFSLLYLPDLPAGEIQDEQQRWNQRHAEPLRPSIGMPRNDPDPERRLRIGFVSADFRDHVVGRSLLPCFAAYDRNRSDWLCYSGHPSSDAIGEAIREASAGWCETAGLSDDALVARIREDRIDILVDLSLHTAGHRLLVFARKPAPVQLSWLGYPGPTGLSAIESWISDPCLAPSSDDRGAPAETSLRLPGCWCCYGEPVDAPDPGELPALSRGVVTFGSFNNVAKINEGVLALWSRLLLTVEGSRLLLLDRGGTRDRTLRFFADHGIGPERIEFLDYYPARPTAPGERQPSEYLRRYRQIDIALDPFPYNGMTTTCDALWMGVPVVALIGRTPISRASFSLLSHAGLPELAAASEEEYLRLAAELARDLPRLTELRATLRARMKNSPLLDAPRFTRNLEGAFRSVWRRWCEGPLAGATAPPWSAVLGVENGVFRPAHFCCLLSACTHRPAAGLSAPPSRPP